MKKQVFNRLKETYGPHASFAIWNNKNLTSTKIFEDSSNIDQLRSGIIFCGLNASAKIRCLGNFHGREEGRPGQGNKDSRLMRAFNKSCFRGAYMTDLFKKRTEANQNELNLSPRETRDAFQAFTKELKDIGTKNPTIIAFGDRAYCYLLEWAEQTNFRGRIEKLYHYSNRDYRRFFKESKKLIKKYDQTR